MAHTTQDTDEVISGINVTPLVDVILVVLIIFIVTTSMIMRSNIPVDLPRAKTAQESTTGLLNVSITTDGQVYVNGRVSGVDQIPSAVAAARKQLAAGDQKGATLSAFVSADVKARYGVFASVVDRLRLEGITDIALDTRPADTATVRGAN